MFSPLVLLIVSIESKAKWNQIQLMAVLIEKMPAQGGRQGVLKVFFTHNKCFPVKDELTVLIPCLLSWSGQRVAVFSGITFNLQNTHYLRMSAGKSFREVFPPLTQTGNK